MILEYVYIFHKNKYMYIYFISNLENIQYLYNFRTKMSLALTSFYVITNPLFLFCANLAIHSYITLYVSSSGIVGYNYPNRQFINFLALIVPTVYTYILLKGMHSIYYYQAGITTFITFGIMELCVLDIIWNRWR